MNNIESLPKELPDKIFTFQIELEGSTTRTKYNGEFIFQIPNLKTQAKISKHKAMLNGGLEDILDLGTRNLHHMISYLKYTLIQVPEFWEKSDCGYDLFDSNVIEEIYNKVLDFEQKWAEGIWGTPQK